MVGPAFQQSQTNRRLYRQEVSRFSLREARTHELANGAIRKARIIRDDAHIFFTIGARGKVFHSAVYGAQACGTKTVTSAGMLYGQPLFQPKSKERFPGLCFDDCFVAIH